MIPLQENFSRIFWPTIHIKFQNEVERPTGFTGFTFIELVLYITILAVIAALMIPTFSSREDEEKIVAAAHEITASLRFARQESRLKGSSLKVSFDTVSERFQVLDTITGAVLYHPVKKQPFDITFNSSSMAGGVDILDVGGATGTVDIIFETGGRPSAPSDTVIRLSYAGHTRNILLQSETGKVSVY